MATADTELREQTEHERVELWRREELERAGFDAMTALELAANPEVDLHLAVELLARGCPAELAARILT
jgi:hypothetical protein